LLLATDGRAVKQSAAADRSCGRSHSRCAAKSSDGRHIPGTPRCSSRQAHLPWQPRCNGAVAAAAEPQRGRLSGTKDALHGVQICVCK
jgi:hypothetical protein